jgi:hypothetical protein
MIIFEEFGGGQAEPKHNVPVFSDHSMGSSTLLALARDGATEGNKRGNPLRSSKRPYGSALVAASAASIRGKSVSLYSTRVAGHQPRTAFSNRELELLEPSLSYCKQMPATVSNRELWTIRSFAALSRSVRDRTDAPHRKTRIADRESHTLASFLPGTAQYVECDVTPTKQTTATFLPGSRFAHSTSRKLKSEVRKYFAQMSSGQAACSAVVDTVRSAIQ